jgi:dTDP-4-dehydrorhamnose reductase
MEKILITGSNGLLGQQLIKDLSPKENYEVFGLSASENQNNPGDFQFLRCDITQKQELAEIFRKIDPQIVIHTAVMGSPDACEKDRIKAWDINVEATDQIAKLCRLNNSHLVHLSTDFIFDGLSGPYVEDDEPNPANYYGLTKLESEKSVSDILPEATILRTVLVYGMHAHMTRANILTRILQAGKNNQAMQIASDQFRTPTFLSDLSEACIQAAQIKPKGVFHISGNEMMSVYEMAVKIARYFHVPDQLIQPIPSLLLNESARRPSKTGFITQKARETLDYRPKTLEEGLKIIANQYNII